MRSSGLQGMLSHTAAELHKNLAAEVFDGASSADVVSALEGRQLLGAGRKGKQMWLSMDGDRPNLLMHFGERHCNSARDSFCNTGTQCEQQSHLHRLCAGMTGYIAIRDNAEGEIHVLAYEK